MALQRRSKFLAVSARCTATCNLQVSLAGEDFPTAVSSPALAATPPEAAQKPAQESAGALESLCSTHSSGAPRGRDGVPLFGLAGSWGRVAPAARWVEGSRSAHPFGSQTLLSPQAAQSHEAVKVTAFRLGMFKALCK